MKELAIIFKNNLWLIFINNKYKYKVEESNYPITAVERKKQIIVSYNKSFVISDHDFTKYGIISSVIIFCNISAFIEESFY